MTEGLIKTKLSAILLLAVFFSTAYADDNLSMKVVVVPPQSAVVNGETFFVNTEVTNTGNTSQHWSYITCSPFPVTAWRAEYNSDVMVVLEESWCKSVKKNPLAEIEAKPGEVFKWLIPVQMRLAAGTSLPKKITFKLGFTPPTMEIAKDCKDGTCTTMPLPKKEIFWSNPVTVTVDKYAAGH